MNKNRLLLFAFVVLSLTIDAQVTLKNPVICHDNSGYLKCYNDGMFKLYFSKGKFTHLDAIDSSFSYLDETKTFTFYSYYPGKPSERIQLQLLPRSIKVIKGAQVREITSMKENLNWLEDFYLSADSAIDRLYFFVPGPKKFRIDVHDLHKGWSWDILMVQPIWILIKFNLYKKNRLEMVIVRDDSLRYGMSVSTTFRSLKKLWQLQAWYTETIIDTNRNTRLTRNVKLENPYHYYYRKNGRLNKKKTVSEIKDCSCE
jgi:hypothetical protein